jgi:hypothetical protein
MTKTTNFEISKKLAEIGFRAKCSYFYFHSNNNDYEASSLEEFGWDEISDCDIEDKYYPSYDLETLLDALPKSIKYRGDTYYFWMTYSGSSDCYIIGYSSGQLRKTELEKYSKENESLVDTAGRLIIWLHEKNLIEF